MAASRLPVLWKLAADRVALFEVTILKNNE